MDKILRANVKIHDGFGRTARQELCQKGKEGFYQACVRAIGQGQSEPRSPMTAGLARTKKQVSENTC